MRKSIAERLDDIREDPKKLKRVFTAIWVVAYAMLMLGAFIILAVIFTERF